MLSYCDFLRIFNEKKRIFFVGIGGISMSALAMYLKSRGCEIAGYDLVPSEICKKLQNNTIPVNHEFREEDFCDTALVVYTGAIHDDNIMLTYPKSLGIPCIPRALLLGYLMKTSKNRIGIAGTHGKSTTTGMCSMIFMEAGRDPTIMVGAEMNELDGSYKIGKGDDFIFEACEYQDSFLNFYPSIAVVLNAEHDHADYFPDVNATIDSFKKYISIAGKDGYAVINADNDKAVKVAENCLPTPFYYSTKKHTDAYARNIIVKDGFAEFDAFIKGNCFCHVKLSVPGLHNVSNALAAISCAYLSGVPADCVQNGLLKFHGVKRRFEFRGKCKDAIVVDEYAHHPDEIKATIEMARLIGYSHITCIYQPHTYTRTKAYFDEFCHAFEGCDEIIFADIYSARETPIENITSENLAKHTKNAKYIGNFDAIADYILSSDRKGLIMVMGAGDIINLTPKILTERV